MQTSPLIRESRPPLRLWREILSIGAFYLLYSAVRNAQPAGQLATRRAATNAHRLITVEHWLGMFHEETIQRWFLGSRLLIQSLNVYYGTAHFVVTVGALVWCFRHAPERYRAIRNGLAFMTGMALIGFAFFPLMPPRLLPEVMHGQHFVDTLKVYGGPWSFDSGPVAKISNQFAAMPSLHFGWASWCAAVWWHRLRAWWQRALLCIYPLLTLFAIVVTANHYFLDAAGGFVVFAIGLQLGSIVERRGIFHLFHQRRAAQAVATTIGHVADTVSQVVGPDPDPTDPDR